MTWLFIYGLTLLLVYGFKVVTSLVCNLQFLSYHLSKQKEGKKNWKSEKEQKLMQRKEKTEIKKVMERGEIEKRNWKKEKTSNVENEQVWSIESYSEIEKRRKSEFTQLFPMKKILGISELLKCSVLP